MARRPQPNWAEVHRELKQSGGTLKALHEDYLAEHPDGLQLSQFCSLYNIWTKSLKSYLRQTHIAGQNVFVDYAGPTVKVHDAQTGQIQTAQVFVGALGASNYVYAEAHWSQSLPNWIAANGRMFEFFGGAPLFIVCDNLKSAVTRANLTDPQVNDSYQAFASHYRATVVPARGYRPKDKAKAEGHVLVVERWILFRLRKRTFTSLGELNDAIRELLDDLNKRPFQKLPGNRLTAFAQIDQPALRPLPAKPFEYVEFCRCRVGMDRMITVKGRPYSVPKNLVNQVVDIRITASVIEVLHGGRRVASHVNQPGTDPVVDPAHLTETDMAFVYWTPEREHRWAETIGPKTLEFVTKQIAATGNRTLGYRLGIGLRRLASEYGAERLESTCAFALIKGASKLHSLSVIIKRDLGREPQLHEEANFEHDNLRGSNYYH